MLMSILKASKILNISVCRINTAIKNGRIKIVKTENHVNRNYNYIEVDDVPHEIFIKKYKRASPIKRTSSKIKRTNKIHENTKPISEIVIKEDFIHLLNQNQIFSVCTGCSAGMDCEATTCQKLNQWIIPGVK
ncbi:MAG: hypothetical protein OIN86_12980 [Candidatus Methanoperedens sp.]|nr:hypothetical protein [Candidatus Methanoperedens sp.]CAG0948709.1 hypothetical protein METP1_00050 [Methanosarcinales archaeon]